MTTERPTHTACCIEDSARPPLFRQPLHLRGKRPDVAGGDPSRRVHAQHRGGEPCDREFARNAVAVEAGEAAVAHRLLAHRARRDLHEARRALPRDGLGGRIPGHRKEVVAADFEAQHPVHLVVPRGQEQHRSPRQHGRLANLAA